jgi:hypothetical protein
VTRQINVINMSVRKRKQFIISADAARHTWSTRGTVQNSVWTACETTRTTVRVTQTARDLRKQFILHIY